MILYEYMNIFLLSPHGDAYYTNSSRQFEYSYSYAYEHERNRSEISNITMKFGIIMVSWFALLMPA